MAKLNVYNMKKEEVGSISLNDMVFDVEYNEPLIHQVIVALHNNARQGTKSTLTRSEVNMTKKKLYRQKGTGNARHDEKSAPQFVGGGVVFAPKPRDYSYSINKKTKRLFALALCRMELSIIAMVGMVMLVGIIVNNGIVLVEYINQLRLYN